MSGSDRGLRLQQPELSPTDVQQQQQHLHSYLELATRLTRPSRPAILLMNGVSGSGKSFVARMLASSLGAVQIRSDVERKRLFGVWPLPAHPSPPRSEMYAPQATQQTYLRLQTLVREIVRAGYSVIVDAAFLCHANRLSFASISDELEIPMVIVACSAPESKLRDRVSRSQSIGLDPSDADVAVLEKQLTTLEPLDASELQFAIAVNTTADDSEAALHAIKNLLPHAAQPRGFNHSPLVRAETRR